MPGTPDSNTGDPLPPKAVSLLAVLAARNEAGMIETTIQALFDEGAEVVLIDNGSVDGTRDLAAPFLGGGLLEIRDLPWRGSLDLGEQLHAKQQVFQDSRHDWHLHVDADEWPRAVDDRDLVGFLDDVPAQYTAVNFAEFVFLPPDGVDMWGRDHRRLATSYYLFAPRPQRLMRAWRRGTPGDHIESGGHTLQDVDPGIVFPVDQVLRHYIGLSWSHAISRRADRTYSSDDLARGWHQNRLDMSAARPVTEHPALRVANPWDTRHLDDSRPVAHHFWEKGFADS